jgi:16S rRNA (guanine966-N2)-methyltransferase
MIRITAGLFRGRALDTRDSQKTRPTQAKTRQALFNTLQTVTGDARVLDLFAGSGTLGFEALSRGASHVTFVENSRQALKMIEKNASTLGVKTQVRIIGESVSTFISSRIKNREPYDLIIADPPYDGGWELKLLETLPWGDLLVPGGLFCLEWGNQKSLVSELPPIVQFGLGEVLEKVREKDYGDTCLTTYVRREAQVSHLENENNDSES